jgi:hypothetical protein
MALTRKDWKLLGTIVLSTQGPGYAQGLRARADGTLDPQERTRLLRWAEIVENAAASPKETVEAIEVLHDLAFGKPKPRKKRSKSRRP